MVAVRSRVIDYRLQTCLHRVTQRAVASLVERLSSVSGERILYEPVKDKVCGQGR
jgi:hypothetical protein